MIKVVIVDVTSLLFQSGEDKLTEKIEGYRFLGDMLLKTTSPMLAMERTGAYLALADLYEKVYGEPIGEITRDEMQRPRLVGGRCDFNLSHSSMLAAVAIADGDYKVGIDVESEIPPEREEGIDTRYTSRITFGTVDTPLADDAEIYYAGMNDDGTLRDLELIYTYQKTDDLTARGTSPTAKGLSCEVEDADNGTGSFGKAADVQPVRELSENAIDTLLVREPSESGKGTPSVTESSDAEKDALSVTEPSDNKKVPSTTEPFVGTTGTSSVTHPCDKATSAPSVTELSDNEKNALSVTEPSDNKKVPSTTEPCGNALSPADSVKLSKIVNERLHFEIIPLDASTTSKWSVSEACLKAKGYGFADFFSTGATFDDKTHAKAYRFVVSRGASERIFYLSLATYK